LLLTGQKKEKNRETLSVCSTREERREKANNLLILSRNAGGSGGGGGGGGGVAGPAPFTTSGGRYICAVAAAAAAAAGPNIFCLFFNATSLTVNLFCRPSLYNLFPIGIEGESKKWLVDFLFYFWLVSLLNMALGEAKRKWASSRPERWIDCHGKWGRSFEGG
jgi:hypothetical protein